MKRRLLTIVAATALLAGVPMAMAMPGAARPTVQADDEDDEEEEVTEEEEGTPSATGEESVTEEDDADTDVRQNAVNDFGDLDDDIDIPVPAFIHRSANHINFNGANWSKLRQAFASSGDVPVSIVHIGDSHLQADIGTGTTRELLQYDFGNAGRGLITPLKMTGTNQPTDFTFSSPDSWNTDKLMSSSWPYTMGFTGTSIHPQRSSSSIVVSTSEKDDYDPFSSVTIFHGGKMTIDSVVNDRGIPVHFRAIPSADYTHIIMASQETRVKIYFSSQGDLTVYGASLSGDRPGVFYHTIGNNGATYGTYNRIGNVGRGVSALNPDLVIISLGTNEAFGRISSSAFYQTIDRLVKNIQQANPDAQILLTTPVECQKKVSRTVTKQVKVPVTKTTRTKGKKGKKGHVKKTTTYQTKTVKSTTSSFAPNAAIKTLRDEIVKYGADNHIAVLDTWEVAGGNGASTSWINNGLYAKDRIHHSYKGYHLVGRLMYDALIDALVNQQ